MKYFSFSIKTLLFTLCIWSNFINAQSNKVVTVLVPFAAGGTVDIAARQLSVDIGQSLGKSVIIENRGGGGGTIAVAALARANPDGSVMMFDHMGITFDQALYDNLPYNTKTDIIPLAYIGATPNVLVVTNKLPVKDIREFIAYARNNPNKLNYGSGGVGSAGHIAMETFQVATNTTMTHVPYKGSGPAITDLISGQIQAMLMTIASIKPYIDAGQVRALATSGETRSVALPNLPTLNEAGLKNFNYSPWYGAFVPAKTPTQTIHQLHEAINQSIENPVNKAKLSQLGLEVKPISRDAFQKMFNADLVKWEQVIKKMNIKNQ
jgi:tripartite-type tricarboxylate transporter receptor subunit TctC